METTLATVVRHPAPIAHDAENGPRRLLDAFLSRRSAATRRAYGADLRDFADWAEYRAPADAVAYLCSREPGPANELALNYKSALIARGLSPATVNRRLSTVRSVVKMARMLGLCSFTLDVEAEPAEAYRDTRGPGLAKVRGLLGHLEARTASAKGCARRQAVRDVAIVRLLFNLGLRRGEVVGLDVAHYDREGGRLSIKGKARTARQWMELAKAPEAVAALDRWLAVRGTAPGPLFVQCDRACAVRQGDGRLSATSLWRMLHKHAIRPHGLRHTAITIVAERNGGDVFAVMAFSRHKSPAVVTRYIDTLRDRAGDGAALLEGLA